MKDPSFLDWLSRKSRNSCFGCLFVDGLNHAGSIYAVAEKGSCCCSNKLRSAFPFVCALSFHFVARLLPLARELVRLFSWDCGGSFRSSTSPPVSLFHQHTRSVCRALLARSIATISSVLEEPPTERIVLQRIVDWQQRVARRALLPKHCRSQCCEK